MPGRDLNYKSFNPSQLKFSYYYGRDNKYGKSVMSSDVLFTDLCAVPDITSLLQGIYEDSHNFCKVIPRKCGKRG
jgi:hypothetical protein